MKRIAAVLLLVFSSLVPAGATHILGGEIYYDHLGGSQYAVTLKLYRDCGPGNSNGTGFDPTAEIGVFSPAGVYQFSAFFSFPGAVTVPVQLSSPCLTVPPTICVEQASYTGTINLPGGTGGYILSYQRCCRVPTILNLNNPNAQGVTCTVRVPDANVVGPNSSPRFTLYPPIALCANLGFVFDHSATDPDGDVLVYELCDPLQGGSQIDPLPSPPAPPPYPPIMWAPGFSTTNQMTAAPGLAIDAASGQLSVTPNLIGSFVVGVRVKEFRGSVLLSEVSRDLRFDVVPCQLAVVSAIQQQQSLCTGTTVNFINQSVNGTSWSWDFGDPNTLADTSLLMAPSYTYSDTGTFTVTLIANPGLTCADTSTTTYEIHYPIAPQFTSPPITCFDAQPVVVDATGNFTALANVEWLLGPQGVPPVVQGDPGLLAFQQPGTYPITLNVAQFGCTGTTSGTIEIHPSPVAYFEGDSAACAPLDMVFSDLSTAWTPLTTRWEYGDGSIGALPQHLYTSAGIYDVRLTVWTTTGCIDTVSHLAQAVVEAFPQPRAGLFVYPPSVNILDPTILVVDNSSDAVNWTYFLDDDVIITTPGFTHTFSDGGVYTIMQVVGSELQCQDTAYFSVTVVDHQFFAPNAFTPNGDGMNDSWLPVVRGAREYGLIIYDRWGQVLFQTTDPHEAWPGTDLPEGVYTYLARVVTYGTAHKEYIGHVTLVR